MINYEAQEFTRTHPKNAFRGIKPHFVLLQFVKDAFEVCQVSDVDLIFYYHVINVDLNGAAELVMEYLGDQSLISSVSILQTKGHHFITKDFS